MSTKEEWVRVESESELRTGMTVEIRPCTHCLRIERIILFKKAGQAISRMGNHGLSFTHTMDCEGDELSIFVRSIREGRLYRLSDLTDDSETTDAKKELVTT